MEQLTTQSSGFLLGFRKHVKIMIMIIVVVVIVVVIVIVIVIVIIIVIWLARTLVASPGKPQGLVLS